MACLKQTVPKSVTDNSSLEIPIPLMAYILPDVSKYEPILISLLIKSQH